MSPERELFVVCNNCGNEVSPYVTECPYCGTRLRKRAPDLKKQKKAEQKAERRAAKKRERLRAQYEGGGAPGTWLDSPAGRARATTLLVAAAVVASVIEASNIVGVSDWIVENLVYTGGFSSLADQPWTLVTSPMIQVTFGYGFVCLLTAAIFGAAIERRYGAFATILVWLVCGAFGVLFEALLAQAAITFGAYAVATGLALAWTVVVVRLEDLRDHDVLGLAAVSFVLCLLPLATDAARIWTLIGGIVGGLLCGAVLTLLPRR